MAKANTTNASPTLLGEVVVIYDPLTDGPELLSKMASTLTVMGRNLVPLKVRELSIIGGTGAFHRARGYGLKQTYSIATATLNAIEHYNVTVIHY
ncbi:hypothetical protein AMTR_s00041p00179230 [Amborella trichopoda]|uniref:Dirigent protein n=1 Tax=Amborella trichopoda TaxID=13333 RepID=W1PZC2_AMBTC|nr:hypothetical protein AMTR_s00041p00179230 [Amborella trichopoda]